MVNIEDVQVLESFASQGITYNVQNKYCYWLIYQYSTCPAHNVLGMQCRQFVSVLFPHINDSLSLVQFGIQYFIGNDCGGGTGGYLLAPSCLLCALCSIGRIWYSDIVGSALI